MDIVGIDISKATFNAALLLTEQVKHAVFSNTEAGFEQLLLWLTKHRPDSAAPMHAGLFNAVVLPLLSPPCNT